MKSPSNNPVHQSASFQCVQVTVDGCAGGVHTFIVEPFVPHQQEFYLCIQSERLGDTISFRCFLLVAPCVCFADLPTCSE